MSESKRQTTVFFKSGSVCVYVSEVQIECVSKQWWLSALGEVASIEGQLQLELCRVRQHLFLQ